MTDDITQQSDIGEAFKEVPEEVQGFMTSHAFEFIVDAIKTVLGLSDAQRNAVFYGAQELLLGTKTNDEVARAFLAANMNEELAAKALYSVHSEILSRAANISEYFSGDDEEPTTVAGAATLPAPSPADVLESLKSRLTAPATIAPIARQNSAPSIGEITKKEAPSPRRFDPYREIPR